MAERIYKYPIHIKDTVHTSAAPGARDILHVGLDGEGNPAVWVRVDMNVNDDTFVATQVFGTGMNLTEPELNGLDYAGSFVQGPFVWHVFGAVVHG